MVGSRKIISQGLRTGSAQEDRSGVLHLRQTVEGVVYAQFQMFRGQGVSDADGLRDVLGEDDFSAASKRGPGNFHSGQPGQLLLDFF